jgi:hypothetical protein
MTGDRYVGEFDGHEIALVRDNWKKTLDLYVDGAKAASESRVLPHDITLHATFVGRSGATHTVVAKAIVHGIDLGIMKLGVTADDSIEVDGAVIPVQKTQ